MIEIQGTYNSARLFTDTCDSATSAQVLCFLNQPSAAGSVIRIMPDCHAGAGCVIGTTMTVTDKVIPHLVGVDIGCGMLAVKLREKRIDLPRFDSITRSEVPSGMHLRSIPHTRAAELSPDQLRCCRQKDCHVSPKVFALSLGTLGGGNHFIELDRDEEDQLWLVIHTGSRRSGKDVAEFYQKRAYEACNGTGRERKALEKAAREKLIADLRHQGREGEIESQLQHFSADLPEKAITVPYELAYCEGDLLADYLSDMSVMQQYASLNRQIIAQTLLRGGKLHAVDQFETIHNYIDLQAMILRKGAVSAQKNERILIPMNMRDGSFLCIGKGNPDWNNSAPHGAGRLLSRTDSRASISMRDYRQAMKGIYTTCVSRATVDESPFAYKPAEEIARQITPTAEIISHLTPIYNFKAGEED
ncbi:MAG: RtcB family protein [Clostridia bacterium]|nr:RtcB family protein [Clostridia bacterium]